MPRDIRADPALAAASARAALKPLARGRPRPLAAARRLPRRLLRLALLLPAALALGAIAAVAAAGWLEARVAAEGSAAAAAMQVERVLVAVQDLPAGTQVSADLFAPADWPAAAVTAAHLRAGDPRLGALEGARLVAPIPAGAPLLEGHVQTSAGDGRLAALLRPGMRAIAIPVSASGAVAGLLAPGDRVDLLLTRTLPSGRTVTATVATAVRVLGLDQRVDPSPGADAAVPATVTLEANPRQAETIALLETLGRVTLALRRPDETGADEEAARRAPAWDSDALGLPAAALAAADLAAARAGADPLPAAAPAFPFPASPAAADAAPADAAPSGPARGTRIEHGVEVVRGASFRGDTAVAAPAPASGDAP